MENIKQKKSRNERIITLNQLYTLHQTNNRHHFIHHPAIVVSFSSILSSQLQSKQSLSLIFCSIVSIFFCNSLQSKHSKLQHLNNNMNIVALCQFRHGHNIISNHCYIRRPCIPCNIIDAR